MQALRLCTGRTAHRGSRGIALLFLDHGTIRGWGVSVTPRPLTPGKGPVPIVQEAGWALARVRTGAENLASTGIRSPDSPDRSQSLYRLSYRAHTIFTVYVTSSYADARMFVINPLKPELNSICYLLALLRAHHFLRVSRIRVKLLTFRLLMSYIYGAPILDVSRSHTTTQHSR